MRTVLNGNRHAQDVFRATIYGLAAVKNVMTWDAHNVQILKAIVKDASPGMNLEVLLVTKPT